MKKIILFLLLLVTTLSFSQTELGYDNLLLKYYLMEAKVKLAETKEAEARVLTDQYFSNWQESERIVNDLSIEIEINKTTITVLKSTNKVKTSTIQSKNIIINNTLSKLDTTKIENYTLSTELGKANDKISAYKNIYTTAMEDMVTAGTSINIMSILWPWGLVVITVILLILSYAVIFKSGTSIESQKAYDKFHKLKAEEKKATKAKSWDTIKAEEKLKRDNKNKSQSPPSNKKNVTQIQTPVTGRVKKPFLWFNRDKKIKQPKIKGLKKGDKLIDADYMKKKSTECTLNEISGLVKPIMTVQGKTEVKKTNTDSNKDKKNNSYPYKKSNKNKNKKKKKK
jgi:hypothetical protein